MTLKVFQVHSAVLFPFFLVEEVLEASEVRGEYFYLFPAPVKGKVLSFLGFQGRVFVILCLERKKMIEFG